MIPDFDKDGLLPPGIHGAKWGDVTARFGWTARRLKLLAGFKRALDSLKRAHCSTAYLDGSFVTDKDEPGDFDGCWDPVGVDDQKLAPVLLEFGNARSAQKTKFGGELFPSIAGADARGTTFLDYFQQDKGTGKPKGIVKLDLGDLP